ncbi:histidine ammonia-lyase [bacterium]|nr:histidine ammonia-lyase [bacterium]
MSKLYIDGDSLTYNDFIDVVFNNREVELSSKAREKVNSSRELVEQLDKGETPIYGINTGFGFLANKKIDKSQIEQLQLNLIRSHCVGVGEPYSIPVTRGIMLLRANVMAKGFSGVRPIVIETLLEMLNKRVTAIIPSQGSVGASGDLAPLAHLALALIGEGEVIYENKKESAKECFSKLSITPVKLKSKEGLVLINGTQAMTANGLVQLKRIKNILKASEIIAAISLDALLGTNKAFDLKVVSSRGHKGQTITAKNMNKLITGSEILESHKYCSKVQDPYSLRCIPQVHGAVRDTVNYVQTILETEMNSATDNPLVFVETGEIISGGNFHGEPVAFGMDFLGIAVSEIGSISERRIEQSVNPYLNEHLPPFLVKNEGINSGFMIAQVTAASLVSENKVYAHPSSVDSIPTSANKEDHVSMGTIGSNKLSKIVDNVEWIIAIEYLTATQGLDFRKPLKGGVGVEIARAFLRESVPFFEEDVEMHLFMNKAKEIVSNESLVNAIEVKLGELL